MLIKLRMRYVEGISDRIARDLWRTRQLMMRAEDAYEISAVDISIETCLD